MKLRFLGTGTSSGVPVLLCKCPVCRSTDPRDTRLRSSAIVEVGGLNLLIDCGPDIRQQLFRAGCPPIDAVLLTHSHYDHVGGIDDLRPYCFMQPGGPRDIPVYARADVIRDLKIRVPYCFAAHPYPGVPRFELHTIGDGQTFDIGTVKITALPIQHDRLSILGFRFGPLAYVTDCSFMPGTTKRLISGLDTLVVNALRIEPHHSHMNLQQALDVIKETAPRRAFLTHLCHSIGLHAEVEPRLPERVRIAFDGLVVDIPD